MIQHHGGTPVIFQSFGLTGQSDEAIVASYANSRVTRMLWLV